MKRLSTLEPKIIYEDEDIIILDKPPWWVVNNSQTTKDRFTIQNWLEDNFQFSIFNYPDLRNGIVHRLDKETSGILVVAKNAKSFAQLQQQFKKREVRKKYTALAHGKVYPEEGRISVPLGRLPWNRRRFGVLLAGREAETSYKVISNFQSPLSKEIFTLLELFPKTGRTHQIRIHLKYLGYPIVSDDFYAGRKTARKDKRWCSRLFLHASEISFKHPNTLNKVIFRSRLPKDLESCLKSLEKLS